MKPKILHISKMKGISGSENHLLTLLSHLDKNLFEVELCIMAEPRHLPLLQDYARQLEEAGVSVVFRPIRRYLDERILWRLASYMKTRQFDIVHTHLIHADLYGTPAAKLAGVPVIISSHHNDDRFRRHRPIIWLNRLLANWQSRIIVISDWVGRFLQDVEKIPADKITRIHYGLDPNPIQALSAPSYIRQEFNIPDDAPVIGTIGRLTAQKGQSNLLQATHQLKNEFPNLRVVIIGDGELRSELKQQAKTLDIAENVIFTGAQGYQETMRLLSGMDFFTLPSLWEGFGLVLLEAMALKKAIVASDVSAIPESVVHGKTGFLVPPEDANSLAETIARLLQNPSFFHQMGSAGHERLYSRFTVEAMVQATETLYKSLII